MNKIKKVLLLACSASYCSFSFAGVWVDDSSAQTSIITLQMNNSTDVEITPQVIPDSSFSKNPLLRGGWYMSQVNCVDGCEWYDKLSDKAVLLPVSNPHHNDIQTTYSIANVAHRPGKFVVNLDGTNGASFMIGQYTIPADGFSLSDCMVSNNNPSLICFRDTSSRNSSVITEFYGFPYPKDGINSGLIINIKSR